MPRKVELFKDRLINQLNPEIDLIFLNFDPKTSTRMFFKREIPNKVTFGFLQNYKKRDAIIGAVSSVYLPFLGYVQTKQRIVLKPSLCTIFFQGFYVQVIDQNVGV